MTEFRPVVSFAAALAFEHEGLRSTYATIPASALSALREVAGEVLNAVLLAQAQY